MHRYLITDQATLAQAGALQLVVDLLAHALDLTLQNPRLLTVFTTLAHAFTYPLQHRQRGFQAMGQVVQGITVALALVTLTAQQAVQ
ncbi:hypothetical protein D3C77_665580 [compost metagenome]